MLACQESLSEELATFLVANPSGRISEKKRASHEEGKEHHNNETFTRVILMLLYLSESMHSFLDGCQKGGHIKGTNFYLQTGTTAIG